MPRHVFTPDEAAAGRFVKGQSGNPGGRGKGIERQFREWLAETTKDGKVRLDAFLVRLEDIALHGEGHQAISAMKLAFERAYGHPKQNVDMTVGSATSELSQLSDEELVAIAHETDHTAGG